MLTGIRKGMALSLSTIFLKKSDKLQLHKYSQTLECVTRLKL